MKMLAYQVSNILSEAETRLDLRQRLFKAFPVAKIMSNTFPLIEDEAFPYIHLGAFQLRIEYDDPNDTVIIDIQKKFYRED